MPTDPVALATTERPWRNSMSTGSPFGLSLEGPWQKATRWKRRSSSDPPHPARADRHRADIARAPARAAGVITTPRTVALSRPVVLHPDGSAPVARADAAT